MPKTIPIFTLRSKGITCAMTCLVLVVATTLFGQPVNQPKPSPTPRRPLPKPVAGSRGFERFAGRDASARLIAGAAIREVGPEGPDLAAQSYEQGEADYEARRYKEAVKAFSEAVRLRPEWVQAHYALALSLIETGELKEAIEEFQQILKLNAKQETKILSYYNLGNLYMDLAEYLEAIASYREAIKLNTSSAGPQLSKPHNNLGLAYAASNQLAEAVTEFEQAVRIKPDYTQALYNLAVAFLQLRKKDKARAQHRILVKLDPELAAKLEALIKR